MENLAGGTVNRSNIQVLVNDAEDACGHGIEDGRECVEFFDICLQGTC